MLKKMNLKAEKAMEMKTFREAYGWSDASVEQAFALQDARLDELLLTEMHEEHKLVLDQIFQVQPSLALRALKDAQLLQTCVDLYQRLG
jgi:hypothetical protein